MSVYGQSGGADILGVFHGRFVAIEVKRPGGDHPVTANQRDFLQRVIAAGGIALVARSVLEVQIALGKVDPTSLSV